MDNINVDYVYDSVIELNFSLLDNQLNQNLLNSNSNNYEKNLDSFNFDNILTKKFDSSLESILSKEIENEVFGNINIENNKQNIFSQENNTIYKDQNANHILNYYDQHGNVYFDYSMYQNNESLKLISDQPIGNSLDLCYEELNSDFFNSKEQNPLPNFNEEINKTNELIENDSFQFYSNESANNLLQSNTIVLNEFDFDKETNFYNEQNVNLNGNEKYVQPVQYINITFVPFSQDFLNNDLFLNTNNLNVLNNFINEIQPIHQNTQVEQNKTKIFKLTDFERNKKHCIGLCHAKRCQSRINKNNCEVKKCNYYKNVLNHVYNCVSQIGCNYKQCHPAKQIINHFTNCNLPDCIFCIGIKKFDL